MTVGPTVTFGVLVVILVSECIVVCSFNTLLSEILFFVVILLSIVSEMTSGLYFIAAVIRIYVDDEGLLLLGKSVVDVGTSLLLLKIFVFKSLGLLKSCLTSSCRLSSTARSSAGVLVVLKELLMANALTFVKMTSSITTTLSAYLKAGYTYSILIY